MLFLCARYVPVLDHYDPDLWFYVMDYRIPVIQGVRFPVPCPVPSPVAVSVYQNPGYAPCDYNILHPCIKYHKNFYKGHKIFYYHCVIT